MTSIMSGKVLSALQSPKSILMSRYYMWYKKCEILSLSLFLISNCQRPLLASNAKWKQFPRRASLPSCMRGMRYESWLVAVFVLQQPIWNQAFSSFQESNFIEAAQSARAGLVMFSRSILTFSALPNSPDFWSAQYKEKYAYAGFGFKNLVQCFGMLMFHRWPFYMK